MSGDLEERWEKKPGSDRSSACGRRNRSRRGAGEEGRRSPRGSSHRGGRRGEGRDGRKTAAMVLEAGREGAREREELAERERERERERGQRERSEDIRAGVTDDVERARLWEG